MQNNLLKSFVVFTVLCVGTLLAHNSFARPTLIELFTSEGCSSCPAGEREVAELNERDDFFALSFHVNYWDKLGWKDKFARKEFTGRQMAYMQAFKGSRLYTPQAIVDGLDDTTASWGWRVKMLAHSAKNEQVNIPIQLTDRVVTLNSYKLSKPVDVWYVTYNDYEESDVTSGENKGERLGSVNVVHSLYKISVWDGKQVSIKLPKIDHAGQNTALIIQEQNHGKILGLYY